MEAIYHFIEQLVAFEISADIWAWVLPCLLFAIVYLVLLVLVAGPIRGYFNFDDEDI